MEPVKLILILLATLALLFGQTEISIYERGAAQIQQGHATGAIALLEPWLKAHPSDLKALTLMGMATAAAGNLEQATPYFEQALRIRPAYPAALKGLAMNEMDLKQLDAARNHFEQLLAVSPNDPVAHAGLGELAFARQDFPAALQHFDQAGPVARSSPRVLIEYAKAETALKRPARAADLLTAMPEQADVQSHFEAGLLLASLKSYKSAARQFEIALPTFPDQYQAGFNLVLARVRAGEYKSAIAEAEQLISKGHQKGELYNLLAEAYEKDGDTKHAYDALRSATRIEPDDEANYVDLVSLCIDHKNYDLASEIADIGLRRIPTSERIHLQRGVVSAMKEQFEAAEKDFQTAETLAPTRSLPYVAHALVMMQMNHSGDAVETLRRRVRQAPQDYLALWYLGEALNRSGTTQGSPEQKEAIAALERSIHLNPDISQSRELLGKLLYREGQLDNAANQLETAIRLDPGNEAAIYQLAQVYSKKGDSARSKPLFAKVSQMKAEERENFATRRLQQIVRADSQTP